jgi:hypothetical protein
MLAAGCSIRPVIAGIEHIHNPGARNGRVPRIPRLCSPPDHIWLVIVGSAVDPCSNGRLAPTQHAKSSMHYCKRIDREILSDLQREMVPADALANACCWKRISQVRGRSLAGNAHAPWDPDGEKWRELCRKRGFVQRRQNPRGF